MIECAKCKYTIKEPEECYRYLRKTISSFGIGEVILQCPNCNWKYVIGGEQDIDFDGNPCINMFGRPFDNDEDKLAVFIGR